MTANSLVISEPLIWRRLRRHQARVRRSIAAFLTFVVGTALICVLLLPGGERTIAIPVALIVIIGASFLAILWKRDGELPLFEVGTVCVAASIVYSVIPFIGFMLSNLTFDQFSDSRLYGYGFDLSQITTFAWRYVVYVACLALVYVIVRGRAAARWALVEVRGSIEIPLTGAFLILLAIEYAFTLWLFAAYRLNLNVSYAHLDVALSAIQKLPYWLWQVTANVVASMLLVKQGLLLLLMRRWRQLRWRIVLITWLTIELIQVTIRLGGRTNTVLLLMSAALLYHRMVRPMKARTAMVAALLLIVGFLSLGFVRGRAAHETFDFRLVHIFTSSNEFQSLFATAYDIYQRKQLGTLGAVPWQLYFSDLYLTIPSQLLPFNKLDPAEWYLEVVGARGTGTGFMFGVMAQAVIGLDWVELAIRGAVLGALLALLHRCYARRSKEFWPTLFYLFVAVWSYYTMRASTFWITHFIVYQFLPVMLIVTMTRLALSGRVREEVA